MRRIVQDMDQFDAARPAIAILLRENGTRPPCHISFLSEESNKAGGAPTQAAGRYLQPAA